ncbi:arginine--tRNA ligase [Candidatus Margulisiibacteriota bacterium]
MLQSKIESLLKSALKELGIKEDLKFSVTVPPRRDLGDYATNVALAYGKRLKKNPLQLADQIAQKLVETSQGMIKQADFVKPGFINIKLADSFIQTFLQDIHQRDRKWGHSKTAAEEKILIEFVSANPTGPLHVGHGRWAVVGDVIASLLEAVGCQVVREYYVNDVGNQIDKLIASIKAVEKGQPVPEGGYGGAYVAELAGKHLEALDLIIKQQTKVLADLNVAFNTWFNESDLHKADKVKQAIKALKDKGFAYEKDGAVWFKSTDFKDEKDRVLVKSDGSTTYFAADVAYHLDKFNRSGGHLIDIWGADHHGYVKRIQAAMEALGQSEDKLEIIIGQLVSLFRGKEPVRMSKRTGEMVTLQELVEEIGADATRFFFAMTDVNSHLNFDLELAKKKSNDNPVYYVQYAHARICSILKKSEIRNPKSEQGIDLSELTHPAERELMLKLLSWPDVVREAARLRHPHRITEYGKELATVFHHFYEKCRVLGSPARLFLVDASRITLRNVLELLGISAPESM